MSPSPVKQLLLARLEAGWTGRISARLPSGRGVDVYLMLGDILAAHASDDREHFLCLLQNRGAVEDARIEALRRCNPTSSSITEELFALVPEDTVLELLFERFRENLLQCLHFTTDPELEELDLVLVDNLQVGHDSRALVDELGKDTASTAALRSQAALVLAPGSGPATDSRHRTLTALCRAPMPMAELLARSPWEGTRTLALVAELLASRGLIARGAAPGPVPVPDELPDEMAAFQDYDRDREGGEFSAGAEDLERIEVVSTPPPAVPTPTPRVVETPLDMGDAENATRAELAAAVSLNFAGPKMGEDESHRKLDVINEVFTALVAALDAAHGPGRGQSRVQLLLEATPGAFAALFKSVEADRSGSVQVETELKNLRKRPASEHRRLLNRGLQDVIERSLSVASEELNDVQLDAFLEHIVGYQQRLGM